MRAFLASSELAYGTAARSLGKHLDSRLLVVITHLATVSYS